MSQQATKKRRRSAKQQTLRQFVEAVRNGSKVTHLGFVYKIQLVHCCTYQALLAVRGDLEYLDGLIPTMIDLSITTDILRPVIQQRLSTWPQSIGIAFADHVAPSALELIVDTGDLLGWLGIYGCPALWNPKLSGPILSTGKNGEVIEDNRDKAIRWDAKLTPELLSTWHEQARTAINEQLPPAEQFPDWRLNREMNAMIVAFRNEVQRWEARDADSGSAAVDDVARALMGEQRAENAPKDNEPPQVVVNILTLTVELGSAKCEFVDSSPFDVMKRLAKRPDMAIAASKNEVYRLRKKLNDADLSVVAEAIVSKGTGRYALLKDKLIGELKVIELPQLRPE